MKQLYEALRAALSRGEDAVLCTILETSGSTPRGPGAKMAVFRDGSIAGTVGGGRLEYQSIQDALSVFHGEAVSIRNYELDGGPLDMVCGGETKLFFQRLGRGDLPWVEAALELLDGSGDSWLVTSLSDGRSGTWDRENGPRFPSGWKIQNLAPLRRRKPVWRDGWFVEPLGRAGKVYVFGGGHVSQALVPVLARTGFRTVVCENRPEFARQELFPDAERVELLEFSELTELLPITPDDCLVIMTRGHRDDYEVLLKALSTGAGYIGVIGSRKKAEFTFQRLREDGYPDADLARVHTPVGLPIGAETPAEIAISVAAELIAHRARHSSLDGNAI